MAWRTIVGVVKSLIALNLRYVAILYPDFLTFHKNEYTYQLFIACIGSYVQVIG